MNANLLTYSEVSKVVSKRIHTSKIVRLCTKGVKAPSGVRLKLKSVKIGKQRYVKLEDLKDFLEECLRHECNIVGFEKLRRSNMQ